MSFQDVGKPGAPQRPQRSHYATQAAIPEGRPSGSLPKTGDPFAQLSDGILQYQVRNIPTVWNSTLDGSAWQHVRDSFKLFIITAAQCWHSRKD